MERLDLMHDGDRTAPISTVTRGSRKRSGTQSAMHDAAARQKRPSLRTGTVIVLFLVPILAF
jgi:hypothetical protein